MTYMRVSEWMGLLPGGEWMGLLPGGAGTGACDRDLIEGQRAREG